MSSEEIQSKAKSSDAKYMELPLKRITEAARESGTFEEEETELLDKKSLSSISKQIREVLRL